MEVKILGPNPNASSRPNRLAAAYASKDNKKILAALTQELENDPRRHDLRVRQARTFEKLGLKGEAKRAYAMVLWPEGSTRSNLAENIGVVESYLGLCEASGDTAGTQKALERAVQVLEKNPRNLPAKPLTRPNEIRAAIAYQAHREASNYERRKEARELAQKAVRLDPSVALYHFRYGWELYRQAVELRDTNDDLSLAVAKWKEAKVALEAGLKARVKTPQDASELEGLMYRVTSNIDMAANGWFKESAKRRREAGGKTYTLTLPDGTTRTTVVPDSPKPQNGP